MLLKESEVFVNSISNELGKSTNFVENLTESGSICKEESCQNNQYKLINFNKSNFSLKYELINKNFDTLKSKIIENHNNNITIIEKIKKNLKENEISNNEIYDEKNKLAKENTSKSHNIIEQKDKIVKLTSDNEKIKELYNNQKENHSSLKKDYEDLIKKYESLYNDSFNFINNTYNKLKDKFEIDHDNSESSLTKLNEPEVKININFQKIITETTNKISEYLDLILNENLKLNSKENGFIEKIKTLQDQIKNLEDERILLHTRLERLTISKDEELSNLDNTKNEEIKKHRESLYEKINSLTKLLEESNYMMSEYENENIRLKRKCDKLEYNLQMLTDSHIELE